MKKNGFTLIELLAVIVILAVIALIATPIVLNIIEDSKDSSNKRSIDGYANAVKYAVANTQLTNATGKISGIFTTSDGKTLTGEKELIVEYDGEVVCNTVEVYSDGSIYLEGCKVNGVESDYVYGTKKIPFVEDSWETIAENVRKGNISSYKVGDTREISLTGFTNEENEAGTYTIRIANTSTPDECNTAGFSQTACGFVIEFVDIITKHSMNSTEGWNLSNMRSYVNETIYNALPDELKEKIIDTDVVSGHVKNANTNFTTTDKIYLLAIKEVWGKDVDSKESSYDTAQAYTRQLDYYESIGVTEKADKGIVKKHNGKSLHWWLRSVVYSSSPAFSSVSNSGGYSNFSFGEHGVAVAFRIG